MKTKPCVGLADGAHWSRLLLAGCMIGSVSLSHAQAWRRDSAVHDPSTILKCDDRYWLFGTGVGLISRSSTNLIHWNEGSRVFSAPPHWTTNAVPGNRGHFWAPDVIQLQDRYLLYYSVSTFGKNTSAIAVASNPTLNPEDPSYAWTDHGPVVSSSGAADYNAIDPCVMRDRDGRLWMAFGSFWSGIKMTELNPNTGMRLETNSPLFSVAWKESIEAPFLHRRGDDYYLFVNWGNCCRGTNSTYEIRVGRGGNVTGPFLDREGKDLLRGGGSLVLASSGNRIGPGHASLLKQDGKEFLSYHYYDAERGGRATLGLTPLRWTSDGWPELDDSNSNGL